MTHCAICKKELTDFNSVKIGIGPVCRAKYGINQQEDLFNNHAVFRIQKEAASYIFIVDCGNNHNCRTVTNDVVWVLKEIDELLDDFDEKRFFYTDSEGQTDEILHEGKTFISFKAGHAGVTL